MTLAPKRVRPWRSLAERTVRGRSSPVPLIPAAALPLLLLAACGGGSSAPAGGGTPPANAAPQVTLTAPAPASEIPTPGVLTLTADASDSDGTVVSVEFFIDGASIGADDTAPYRLETPVPGPGDITLTVRARDDDGAAATSAPVTVVAVVADGAPAIALSTPEDGQRYATPGGIDLSIRVTDGDAQNVVQVEYRADGQPVATSDSPPAFEARWVNPPPGELLVTATATTATGATSASAAAVIPIFSQGTFAIDEQRLGDPDTCYGNPEFSDDGRWMLWFEETGQRNADGLEIARMWHCAVDPDTGDFVPPDCRGYTGFETTLTNRAYFGRDATGVIYVGADADYNLTLVRPTGPTSGDTTTFATRQDPERRGIYPSVLSDRDTIYVYWLKSIGGLSPGDADTVELRVVNLLDAPTDEIVLSRQDRPDTGLAPMDITFPRWSWREPVITYGEIAPSGAVEIYAVDVTDRSLTQLTDDGDFKVGQFPVVYNGERYLAAGLFPTVDNVLYREPTGGSGFWQQVDSYRPPAENTFEDACQAASNEPFVAGGRLYTTYQVASCFDQTNVFFTNTSEVWFTELLDGSDRHWRLSSGGSDVKNEPEPLLGTSDAWVYYTRYPLGENQNTACFGVVRAATPLND